MLYKKKTDENEKNSWVFILEKESIKPLLQQHVRNNRTVAVKIANMTYIDNDNTKWNRAGSTIVW